MANWTVLNQPGGGSSSGVPYPVPVVAGTATPDASQGANLLVLTAADCLTDSNGNLYVNVAPPINYSVSAGILTNWQLNTQEDPSCPWIIGTAYVIGNVAFYGPSFYIAIANSAGQEPDTSPTYWTRINGYSTIFDPSYKIGFSVASTASPANTQCHVDFKTDSSGVTTPTGCLIDQRIS
jgi:hypothetical protein